MNKHYEEAVKGLLEDLAVRNYDPNSQECYRRALGHFFRFLEGEGIFDLREVGREVLKAYQAHLVGKKTPKGEPYTWGTQCTYFRPVRRLFGWMEKTQQIFINPAQFIPDPKRGSRLPKKILTEEEVERLMAVPDLGLPTGFRDRTIMEVFYSTGIRLSEMLNLKLGDIDLQEKVVRVYLGKGAKDRVVPIGEKACEFVRKYLEAVRPRLMRGEEEPPQMWLSQRGKPLMIPVLHITFRYYGRKAGLPLRLSPHAFRHAFATHLLRGGADIAAVSKMLGHASLKVTQIYTHLAAVDVKKAHEETHPRERQEEAVVTPEILRLERVAP